MDDAAARYLRHGWPRGWTHRARPPLASGSRRRGRVPAARRAQRATVQSGSAGIALGSLAPQQLRAGLLALSRVGLGARALSAHRSSGHPDPDPVLRSLPRRRHRRLGIAGRRPGPPGGVQGRCAHGPADRPVRPGRARGTASGQQRRRHHRLVQHPRPRRAFHRAAPARDRGLRRQPPRAAFLADTPGQAIPVARSGLLPPGRQGRRGDDDLRRLRGVRDRAGRCGDDSTPAGPDDERKRAHDQLQRRPLPQRRGPDRAPGGGLEQHRRRRGRRDLRGHLQAHAPHRPRRPAQPAHLDVERALRRRAAASRPSGSGSDRARPRR